MTECPVSALTNFGQGGKAFAHHQKGTNCFRLCLFIRMSPALERRRRNGVYLAPGGRESKINGLAAASGNSETCTSLRAAAKPLILQERGSEGKLRFTPQCEQECLSATRPPLWQFQALNLCEHSIESGKVACAKAKCMKLLSPPPGGRSARAALSSSHNHHLGKCVNPAAPCERIARPREHSECLAALGEEFIL